MPAPVTFAFIRRAVPDRRGVVPPAAATTLPNFENNRPIRAPGFRPRRPGVVDPLFPNAAARPPAP
jgi:hypothetical protein